MRRIAVLCFRLAAASLSLLAIPATPARATWTWYDTQRGLPGQAVLSLIETRSGTIAARCEANASKSGSEFNLFPDKFILKEDSWQPLPLHWSYFRGCWMDSKRFSAAQDSDIIYSAYPTNTSGDGAVEEFNLESNRLLRSYPLKGMADSVAPWGRDSVIINAGYGLYWLTGSGPSLFDPAPPPVQSMLVDSRRRIWVSSSYDTSQYCFPPDVSAFVAGPVGVYEGGAWRFFPATLPITAILESGDGLMALPVPVWLSSLIEAA